MKASLQILAVALCMLIPGLTEAQINASSAITRYNEGITAPVKELTFRKSAAAEPNFFNSTENDLLVYPAPVTSTFHIVMNELAPGEIRVEVISMNGNVARRYHYVAGSDLLEVNITG